VSVATPNVEQSAVRNLRPQSAENILEGPATLGIFQRSALGETEHIDRRILRGQRVTAWPAEQRDEATRSASIELDLPVKPDPEGLWATLPAYGAGTPIDPGFHCSIIAVSPLTASKPGQALRPMLV